MRKDPMSRHISSRWTGLRNLRMAEKLTYGECIDLSECERVGDCYKLKKFVEGSDYCNAATETWIWSIGKDKKTGEILAAHDTRFYNNPMYECIWLR